MPATSSNAGRATALTSEAIEALRGGDKMRARTLLSEAIQIEPANERAWLWRSGAAEDNAERRACLERVLSINPQNSAAQKGLASLPPDTVAAALDTFPGAAPVESEPPVPEAAPDRTYVSSPAAVLAPPASLARRETPLAPKVAPRVSLASAPQEGPAYVVALASAKAAGRREPAFWVSLSLVVLVTVCAVGLIAAGLISKRGAPVAQAAAPMARAQRERAEIVAEQPTVRPTARPRPTTPPASPTATVPPAPTAMPGWSKFEGGDAVLWLPESYWGGDPTNPNDAVVEQLRSQRSISPEVASLLRSGESSLVLLALDAAIGPCGCSSGVTMIKVKADFDTELNAVLDLVVDNLSGEHRVLARETVLIDGYQAKRLIIGSGPAGSGPVELTYLIKSAGVIWAVSFSTYQEEFEQRLPIYEQSIGTFRDRSGDI